MAVTNFCLESFSLVVDVAVVVVAATKTDVIIIENWLRTTKDWFQIGFTATASSKDVKFYLIEKSAKPYFCNSK